MLSGKRTRTNHRKVIRAVLLILVALCIVYSVSIYFVASGTLSFTIWLMGAAFFGCIYYLSGGDRWKHIPKFCRVLMVLTVTVCLTVFIVCEAMMVRHFNDRGEDSLDYIIVLGAYILPSGPSVLYRNRLDTAYDYLMDNPDTVCIVTGEKGRNEVISEGEGGKNYLTAKGIPAERVIAETKAKDTPENIRYSYEIIDSRRTGEEMLRIGIVTNNFHVFRGVHLAMAHGEDKICGIAAKVPAYYLPNNMTREFMGVLRDLRLMEF